MHTKKYFFPIFFLCDFSSQFLFYEDISCYQVFMLFLGEKYLLKVFKCLEYSEDKMASSILKIDLFPFTFQKKSKWKVQ